MRLFASDVEGLVAPLSMSLPYIDQVRKSVASHWLIQRHPFHRVSSGHRTLLPLRLAGETGGFALARPPGHRVYPGHCSGFLYLQ